MAVILQTTFSELFHSISIGITVKFVPEGPNGNYRKSSNISHTLVGNNIVDHSDVVGASPVGAAPTTSSFLT